MKMDARPPVLAADRLSVEVGRRDVCRELDFSVQPGDTLVILGRWDWEGPEDAAIAMAALTTMGLDGFAERQVPTLSGGERQRLAIAALLVQQPRLYLLDEPLSHLDLHHEITVLDHFRDLAAAGAGVVMVLHDINLAARYASHVLLLDGEGGHVIGTAAEVLTAERLSAAFGHPLRAVVDGNSTLFVPV